MPSDPLDSPMESREREGFDKTIRCFDGAINHVTGNLFASR